MLKIRKNIISFLPLFFFQDAYACVKIFPTCQGSSVVEHRIHIPAVVGSNPTPGTKTLIIRQMDKTFKFEGYEDGVDRGEVVFNYSLTTPNESIKFSEKLTFPVPNYSEVSKEIINKILEPLALIIGISYWKLYCPENIDLGDIKLTSDQATFWNELYINGLGEFFYKNRIDFTKFNLFSPNSDVSNPIVIKRRDRSLVGMGGGTSRGDARQHACNRFATAGSGMGRTARYSRDWR